MTRIFAVGLFILGQLFSWQNATAIDQGFAVVVTSPNSQKVACLQANGTNLLEQLKTNGFNPKQDETGFIYSLLGYDGPTSGEPAAQQAFWALWQTEQLSFAQLGSSQITPRANDYYVFHFGNGSRPTNPPSFQQVCAPTPTASPTAEPVAQVVTPDLSSGLGYLRNNYASQPAANQDWAAIALASHSQNVSVAPSSQTSILSLSRNSLALTSQNQAASNQVDKIKQSWTGSQFGDSQLINDDIFAVLAIQATDPDWLIVRKQALETMTNSQNSNGSFGYSLDSGGDTDMTAAAIWALATDKANYPSQLDLASSYLNNSRNADGGYGYRPGQSSNIASTSWAIMAKTALAQDTAAARQYLAGQQLSNGSWPNAGQENYLNTAYAVLALSGRWLPIKATQSQPQPLPKPELIPRPTIVRPQPKPASQDLYSVAANTSISNGNDESNLVCTASASVTVISQGGSSSATASASASCR